MTNDDGISIYANLIKEEGYPLGFSAFWLIGKISQYAFRDILSLLHLVVKPLIPVRGGVTPHPWANHNPHALRSYNDSCSAWISPYCACTRGSIRIVMDRARLRERIFLFSTGGRKRRDERDLCSTDRPLTYVGYIHVNL